MQIVINTAEPLSPEDRSLIAALIGLGSVEPVKPAKPTVVTEPAKVPAKAPAKPTVVEEPEVEVEVEVEAEEDLIGGEPDVQDAIDAATVLVNSGKQARVKAALKAIGVDRVSNIPTSKVQAFIDALEG